MSEAACPRCGGSMPSGRVQWNLEAWCFDCSMYPHDVRVRIRKQDGTFVAPKGPIRIDFTRLKP